MSIEEVILVNEADEELGTIEKMEAHQKALLHRAFSVFIFNSKGEMLLQRRALGKYHSGGLWTNACCSHPRPGETVEAAATRRTMEELGFQPQLKKVFAFTYRADFENGLTEYEYDHVLMGSFDGEPDPNPDEVSEYRYQRMDDIKADLESNPGLFTEWFKIVFHQVEHYLHITNYGLRISDSL